MTPGPSHPKPPRHSWIQAERCPGGLTRLRAELIGEGHGWHRHDTYTISTTDWGVQAFRYRGALHRCVPGQVVVLHPDEAHDGGAGDGLGFGYRSLYLEPAAVHDAAQALAGGPVALPFLRDPAVADAARWHGLFERIGPHAEPLAVQEAVLWVSERLLAASGGRRLRRDARLAHAGLARAAEFLRAHAQRRIGAAELEAASGLSRAELQLQFRRRYGTTPHRYQLQRRLELVRERLQQGAPAAQVAAESGFADQAHLTRVLRQAWGFTPARLGRLLQAAGA